MVELGYDDCIMRTKAYSGPCVIKSGQGFPVRTTLLELIFCMPIGSINVPVHPAVMGTWCVKLIGAVMWQHQKDHILHEGG